MTTLMLSQAPTWMVMPEPHQMVFTVLNWIIVTVVVAFASRDWRRGGSPLALLFLAGGACAVGNEAIVDVLGLCWFPDRGSVALYQAWGVTVPAYMLPVYAWFVGGQAWLCYRTFSAGITRVRFFQMYGLFALINIALEVPPLMLGMHAYYGPQPFVIFGFPAWWAICNALMPISAAAVAIALGPVLTGWRRWLVIPLVPMVALATNAATVFPVWLTLNAAGPVATHVAALISLGLGLALASAVSLIVADGGSRLRLALRPQPT